MTTEEKDAPEVLSITPTTAESLERAAIDVAVSTARRYPRTIKQFQVDLETWATATEEIARECFYVLERENRSTGRRTQIIGPSVRFAELVLAAYRNLAVDVRIEGDDGSRITVVAVARDMERNIGARVPVVRRVTDRRGNRYSDDVVNVTIQAAASIAKRNAIMGVVPRALWASVYGKAMSLARGDALSMHERLSNAVKAMASVGVREDRLLAFLQRPSMADVTAEDLLIARLAYDEIRRGERDPESICAPAATPTVTPAAQGAAVAAQEAADKAAAGPKPAGRKPRAPTAPEPKQAEPKPAPAPAPEAGAKAEPSAPESDLAGAV